MPFLADSAADFAALVPRITGTLSAVSSSMIIFLIFRSQVKLSTIYHRIMFAMSIADILAATAMALTTLPMPRNGDSVWFNEFEYKYDEQPWEKQTKFGNYQTCQAQGFFFSAGISIMFAYNTVLCVYYACAIGFNMRDKDICKKFEPYFHIVPLLLGLAPSIPAFVLGYYRPISNDAWCTLQPGRQGQNHARLIFTQLMLASIGTLLPVTLICFGLIIWRVRKNYKRLALLADQNKIHVEQRVNDAHRNTKLIILQSAAYSGAFVLTLVFPFVRTILHQSLRGYLKDSEKAEFSYVFMGKLMLVFMPLQGFFNFIIFLWHKGKDKHCSIGTFDNFPSLYSCQVVLIQIIVPAHDLRSGDISTCIP